MPSNFAFSLPRMLVASPVVPTKIANSYSNSRDVEMLGGDELEGIEDMELEKIEGDEDE